jgi:hypothetical protein
LLLATESGSISCNVACAFGCWQLSPAPKHVPRTWALSFPQGPKSRTRTTQNIPNQPQIAAHEQETEMKQTHPGWRDRRRLLLLLLPGCPMFHGGAQVDVDDPGARCDITGRDGAYGRLVPGRKAGRQIGRKSDVLARGFLLRSAPFRLGVGSFPVMEGERASR